VAVGWYVVHPANCTSWFDGTYYWLYVYPSEGGYFFTANLQTQTAITPACQTGNLLAFYVYNTSGNWAQVQTFNHR